MKDHYEYCMMKPKQCRYCELHIPQHTDEYSRHVEYCGSKTRDCEVCGSAITARELESHIATGECDTHLTLKFEREEEVKERTGQEKSRVAKMMLPQKRKGGAADDYEEEEDLYEGIESSKAKAAGGRKSSADQG
jgi:hypothetical protein